MAWKIGHASWRKHGARPSPFLTADALTACDEDVLHLEEPEFVTAGLRGAVRVVVTRRFPVAAGGWLVGAAARVIWTVMGEACLNGSRVISTHHGEADGKS